ncbi:hypothetical protein BG006_000828 [Podila minutissima]|uniref:Serine/threonine-protein phosphatase n=1 Tax=Podila minutissima TaxID=64525 RepID=A0A9P5VHL2_9FUNG|nr:hypothetical protein BG006_000828 [Podila minutissima]
MGNQLAKRPSPKGSRSSSIGDTKYDSSLSSQSQSSTLSNHSFNSNTYHSSANNNNTSSKSKNNKNNNSSNNNLNTESNTSNKTHGNSNGGNGNTGPPKNIDAQPKPSHERPPPPSPSAVETSVASDHPTVKDKNKNENSSTPSAGPATSSANGSGSTGSTLTEGQGSHANPGVQDRSSSSHGRSTGNSQGSVGEQHSSSSDTLINGVGKDPKRNSLDTQQPQQPSPLPQPSSAPSCPEPSIPFAVASPGNPILVKRHLAPLSIAPGHASTLPTIRSPPAPLSPNALQAKSMEHSPTFRKSFLGPADGKGSKSVDVDDMISRLLDAGYSGKISKSVCLKNSEILFICQQARDVFLSQPTLIELNAPVKIVGDIHGQYTDLLRLFEMCGFPPSANFLFLGDYVDRGRMSLETILLLFCYKIKYPENFFLLRGNHECANVTKVYGFYDECKRRASIKMWKAFVDVFNCLPLAAIVANKIFCVHGGLSPSLGSMDDIRALRRPTDVPDYGLLNDLLWSDPSETAVDWEDNERGVSYCFGRSIIQKFLNRHDFDLVCRAHMVVEDGYEFFNDRTLVTVFSAPNYCGEFDNFGAVMSVNEDLLCSFELLKPIDQATARAQMQSLAASAGGWRVNKQRLSIPDSNSLFSSSYNNMANM